MHNLDPVDLLNSLQSEIINNENLFQNEIFQSEDLFQNEISNNSELDKLISTDDSDSKKETSSKNPVGRIIKGVVLFSILTFIASGFINFLDVSIFDVIGSDEISSLGVDTISDVSTVLDVDTILAPEDHPLNIEAKKMMLL